MHHARWRMGLDSHVAYQILICLRKLLNTKVRLASWLAALREWCEVSACSVKLLVNFVVRALALQIVQ